MRPMPIDRSILKRDFPISVAAAAVVLAGIGFRFVFSRRFHSVTMSDSIGMLTRPLGMVLLVLFVLYMIALALLAKKKDADEDCGIKDMPLWRSLLFIAFGVALIVAGGHFVVRSAREIAVALGMSETLIGLTVVAIGTSLPELVTSVVASYKGENGLAAGNAIGSNIFNILLILGVSGTINLIAVNFASFVDLLVLIAVSLITYVFAITRNISRVEGGAMVALYAAYVVFAFVR
jgi:cation:H+ antiporter